MLAAAYAIIVTMSLARHGDLVVLLGGGIAGVIGYAMSRPVADVAIDRNVVPRVVIAAGIVIGLLVVALAAGSPVWPVIAGSFCAGNRLRAGSRT